jgi:hypothetical protein
VRVQSGSCPADHGGRPSGPIVGENSPVFKLHGPTVARDREPRRQSWHTRTRTLSILLLTGCCPVPVASLRVRQLRSARWFISTAR